MFEKVNPKHPDKVADRIAGALVDLAYKKEENPKCAFEVLIGHGECNIIGECSVFLGYEEIKPIVDRIAENTCLRINCNIVKQDTHLARNQDKAIRCGDNGIFKGVPLANEERELSQLSRYIYNLVQSDGKYIIEGNKIIVCQSKTNRRTLTDVLDSNFGYTFLVNPIGDWTGGIDVDAGATNRKLGSDMAQSVTGGGLHGKDLSKADVSVNIYAWLKAQETGEVVKLSCAIGDEKIDGKPYSEVVDIAREFIKKLGGFEKFAEWGLF